MSGVTKHIYEHEIRDIKSMWNWQLADISGILPREYQNSDIVEGLKRYFPYEWESVEIKYEYYKKKDKHIKKYFGRSRYNMPSPLKLLETTKGYKRLISDSYRNRYAVNFSEGDYNARVSFLVEKRNPKKEKITNKINQAKMKTQQVTPDFVDQLIGLYERKNTTQKDKVYIIAELKKYYSPKIIQFFFKLNDTELNRQLREEAFFHLQSFNYQPRLRRQKYMHVHAGNKKRKQYLNTKYPDEKYSIPQNPNELEYRIQSSKEQKIKSYDFFISHSSKDSTSVQKLIIYENERGQNIYCDWIDDADYLKRHLVCNATLKVIEKRLDISKQIIYVKSSASEESIWCKYELNYFARLSKKILFIEKADIENDVWKLKPLPREFFWDEDYQSLDLSIPELVW